MSALGMGKPICDFFHKLSAKGCFFRHSNCISQKNLSEKASFLWARAMLNYLYAKEEKFIG